MSNTNQPIIIIHLIPEQFSSLDYRYNRAMMITTKTNILRYSFLNVYPASLTIFLSLFIFASVYTRAISAATPGDSVNAHPLVAFVDCPDLGANFGDACDDENEATLNDMVNGDCICQGTYPPPANDLSENAQVLPLNTSNSCDSNQVLGTTLGANDDLGPFTCDSLNGPWPDVFYTFNSGNYLSIEIDISLITQTDVVVSLNEVGGDGEVIHCSLSETFYFMATKNSDYIIRVAPASGSEGAGEFGICLSAMHLCEEMGGLDPGDPCYLLGHDGFVNDYCECEVTIGNCQGQFGGDLILNGTNEVQSIGIIEAEYYVEYINAFEGNQYTLTSNLVDEYYDGYITIRQSGTVIGQGYSPVTVTAIEDGSISATYTYWDICEALGYFYFDTSIQCITCDYDCPSIGADIGDACDDANPNTSNDIIDEECNCIGEFESGSLSGTADWNNSCGDRSITLTFYAPGNATLLYSYTTTIDENGDFDLSDSIAAGNYDIYAKIDGTLAKSYLNEYISAGANTLLLGSFIPGDLSDNNFINISDFSLLNVSFGSIEGDANYNYLADMNCDGTINIIEFSLLNIGFGQTGASPD